MRKFILFAHVVTVLFCISACAKYSLKGGGKARKNESVKNVVDPGGTDINGNYTSQDGRLQLNATPNNAGVGTPITYTAQCFDNRNVTVRWEFPDGTTADGLSTTKVYPAANTYTAHAICTASNGETRRGQVSVTIAPSSQFQYPYPGQQNNGDCCCCCCCCCQC